MVNSNALFPVQKKCLYPSQQVATDTLTGQFVYEFWMRDDIKGTFEIYNWRANFQNSFITLIKEFQQEFSASAENQKVKMNDD